MNIWLIRRPASDCNPSEWVGAVVAAGTEREAWTHVEVEPGSPIYCILLGVAKEGTKSGTLFTGYADEDWSEYLDYHQSQRYAEAPS